MNASTSRWISSLFLTALGPLPAIRGGQNFVCDARKRPADEALRLAVVEMTGGGLGE
jgi:hypothetical protein